MEPGVCGGTPRTPWAAKRGGGHSLLLSVLPELTEMPELDGIERDPSKVDFTKDGTIKLYPDDPTSKSNMRTFRHKEQSKFFDPCSEAAAMSLKCLERNNYERKPCRDYFEAYRDCAAEWKKKR